MLKHVPLILFSLFSIVLSAQDVVLPIDLRQHNLTHSNTFVGNPAFSINNEMSNSIGFWTRWQWQQIDGDPTTLFINYNRKLGDSSVLGGGFFQHNTGVFLHTGGVVNYAYEIVINPRTRLTFGLNIFGYNQELIDDRFQLDPQIQLPQFETTDGFILQMAPGIQFTYDQLNIGFTSENMVLYNFTTKEGNEELGKRIFAGMLSYDLPVTGSAGDNTSLIRPMIYIKSIPGFDTQVGLNALWNTNKFWAQAGYNNFYGINIGAGGKFKGFALGALVEFGTDNVLKDKDPTLEFVTSFDFGKINQRSKAIEVLPEEEEEIPLEDIAEEVPEDKARTKAEELALKNEARTKLLEERKKTRDSLALIQKETAIAENIKKSEIRKAEALKRKKEAESLALSRKIARQKRTDSLAAVKTQRQLEVARIRQEQYRNDSIKNAERELALVETERQKQQDLQNIKKAEEEAAELMAKEQEEQRKLDSIAKVAKNAAELEKQKETEAQKALAVKEDKPKAGERYEETVSEDGLAPGYYLIANVFGTKKYFDAFMADLTKKGLQPKSFYRSLNKYNYVYLGRYDNMTEARKARDGNLGGKYNDKTWIYRVVGN